jgi:hypothetical protein
MFKTSTRLAMLVFAIHSSLPSAEASVWHQASISVDSTQQSTALRITAEFRQEVTGEEWESLNTLGVSWGAFAKAPSPEVAATSHSFSLILPASAKDSESLKMLPSLRIKRIASGQHRAKFAVDVLNHQLESRQLEAGLQERLSNALAQLVSAELGGNTKFKGRVDSDRHGTLTIVVD